MSELEKQLREIEENYSDFEKLIIEIKKVYPRASIGQNTGPHRRWIYCSLNERHIEIKWLSESGFIIFLDRTEEPVSGSEEQNVTYLNIQEVMVYFKTLFP